MEQRRFGLVGGINDFLCLTPTLCFKMGPHHHFHLPIDTKLKSTLMILTPTLDSFIGLNLT